MIPEWWYALVFSTASVRDFIVRFTSVFAYFIMYGVDQTTKGIHIARYDDLFLYCIFGCFTDDKESLETRKDTNRM